MEQENHGDEDQGISSDPDGGRRLCRYTYQGQQEDQNRQRRRPRQRIRESLCREISQDASLSLVPDVGLLRVAEVVYEVQHVESREREAEDYLRGPTGVLVR